MIFQELSLHGAYRIEPQLLTDERGAFARRYCSDSFQSRGLQDRFLQSSISINHRAGTLRGMHYQAPPYLETKLVRCTRGSVFDVIVDLRDGSKTYGQWHSEILSAENHIVLYIPKGFAHGFQALAEGTELDYEITPEYVPGLERGFRFDDPALLIPWPIRDNIVSDRDKSLQASHIGLRL